jgi:hypothetical protein
MAQSNITQFLNSVQCNLRFNVHCYECAYLQSNGECNCDRYSDEELVAKVALEFGYAFFPLEILKDYPLATSEDGNIND